MSRKASKPKTAKRNPAPSRRPSSLVDTRIIYCGDCLDQLQKLPDACVDLIYIDPPLNSNRNYEVFCGGFSEPRPPALYAERQGLGSEVDPPFEDRHASTQSYIEYMRPRCVELARVLKDIGSFCYHCDSQAQTPRASWKP